MSNGNRYNFDEFGEGEYTVEVDGHTEPPAENEDTEDESVVDEPEAAEQSDSGGDVRVALRRRGRYTDSDGRVFERDEEVSVTEEVWEQLKDKVDSYLRPIFERLN